MWAHTKHETEKEIILYDGIGSKSGIHNMFIRFLPLASINT